MESQKRKHNLVVTAYCLLLPHLFCCWYCSHILCWKKRQKELLSFILSMFAKCQCRCLQTDCIMPLKKENKIKNNKINQDFVVVGSEVCVPVNLAYFRSVCQSKTVIVLFYYFFSSEAQYSLFANIDIDILQTSTILSIF